jgi:hypothetical protein
MNEFAELPYLVHTGHELELMVTGMKPLAIFHDSYPGDPCEEIIPENAFKPYVEAGSFEQREFVELLDRRPPATHRHVKGVRWVMYSTVEERWRIDAYIEMQAQSRVLGWSEAFERREGFLLGYEDWQTNAWITFLLGRPHAKNFPWLQRLAAKRADVGA